MSVHYGGRGPGHISRITTSGGGAAVPVQTVAQRLLTSKRAASESVMSSPPTISNTGIGTVSSINGNAVTAPAISPANAAISAVGGIIGDLGSGLYGAKFITEDGALTGASIGVGIAFTFTGQAFDMALQSTNGYAGTWPRSFRIRVNGEWTHSTDRVMAGGAAGYSKVDFGSTVTNAVIEIFFNYYVGILGLNISAGASIAAASFPSTDLKVAVIGDSYTVGLGATGIKDGLSQRIGRAFGIRNIISSGVGGQGWVTAIKSNTFGQRIAAGDLTRLGALDVIFMYGSVNDEVALAASIQTATQAGLAAVVAQFPNALKICISSFSCVGHVVPSAQQDAAYAGFLAAADSNTIVLNARALGVPLVRGVTGADNIHPTADESSAISSMIADLFEMTQISNKASYAFTDDFNRANESLEASANWTRVGGTAGMATVSSNRLASATTDSTGAMYQIPDAGLSPQGIAYVPVAGSAAGPCISCRAADNGNFLGMRYDGTNVAVFGRVGGVTGTLYAGPVSLNLTTDELALEAIGQVWVIRKNGALVTSQIFQHTNTFAAATPVPYSTRQGVGVRVASGVIGDNIRRYVP